MRMSEAQDEIFTISPDYGHGMMRRRIRLTAGDGMAFAELEDHAHAMRCRVLHDGEHITAIEPEFMRFPMSTCASAAGPIAELVGHPLAGGARAIFAKGRARRNCTHMLDLVWLAAAHACRGGERIYDIEIPDSLDDRAYAELYRDGEKILRWELDGSTIIDPEPFAGRPLYAGLVSWALDTLDDDMIEATFMLQKGCLITSARRYGLPTGPLSEQEKSVTVGACHGLGAERIDAALRQPGSQRDFTDHPERLLRFL